MPTPKLHTPEGYSARSEHARVAQLVRFCYCDWGTFGRLTVDGLTLYTVERPWLNNRPGESCVPVGWYRLEAHHSKTYPRTWALVGETVSHYPTPGKARSAILLHAGNTMDDLEGCIAPGLRLGYLFGKWAVLQSRQAMDKLRAYQLTDLEITNHTEEGNLP